MMPRRFRRQWRNPLLFQMKQIKLYKWLISGDVNVRSVNMSLYSIETADHCLWIWPEQIKKHILRYSYRVWRRSWRNLVITWKVAMALKPSAWCLLNRGSLLVLEEVGVRGRHLSRTAVAANTKKHKWMTSGDHVTHDDKLHRNSLWPLVRLVRNFAEFAAFKGPRLKIGFNAYWIWGIE